MSAHPLPTYLARAAPSPSATKSRKLRKDERTGSVLPPPSQWSRGPVVYGHATGLAGVGSTGYQSTGYQPAASYGGNGYGSLASTYTAGGLTGTNSLRGGSYGGGTGQGATGGGRLQQKIEEAKEKNKERRERHQAKRRPDEISKKNLVVDDQGVAHDSEYVQFRTAVPIHNPKRPQAIPENPNDDDSASSSSASSSSSSGFHSSPYTYQSTHRTASTSYHHSTHGQASTISAIPPHIAGHHRTTIDGGPSSLSVPRAPSLTRGPSSSASLYGDSTAAYGNGDRLGHGSRTRTSKMRSASTPTSGATTASYQPPAPAFGRSNFGAMDPTLRNPSGMSSSDGHSLADSTAQLSLGSTIGGANESGYTKAIKNGHGSSIRPAKLDGSALDAGVHGMKRSFDGFKLDVKFGLHKAGKKMTRKINGI
ncbi:hypothetical protein JCM10207_000985 [Rhodosporidiobolus poonsookiae]